jgi:hypothetical protein
VFLAVTLPAALSLRQVPTPYDHLPSIMDRQGPDLVAPSIGVGVRVSASKTRKKSTARRRGKCVGFFEKHT